MSAPSYWKNKTYWIVGASAGLGEAIAKDLSAAGANLILSARNDTALLRLSEGLPAPSRVAPCDVADLGSLEKTAQTIGEIDGLIFCAGIYQPLRAQNWSTADIVAMCDVNFTGAARTLSVAIPRLKQSERRHIVLIGSIAGMRGLPGAMGYGASKAGVMHLGQTLNADLGADGWKIQVINPGFIKTRLTDKNTFKMPFIMTPEEAAQRVRKAMQSSRFETYFPTRFAMMFRIMGLLPDKLYYPFIRLLVKPKPTELSKID